MRKETLSEPSIEGYNDFNPRIHVELAHLFGGFTHQIPYDCSNLHVHSTL